MRMSKLFRTASCGAFAFALVNAAGAMAQDQAEEQDAASDEAGNNVIIVTAQFREQNLQEIPIAISAIGGDDIASKGISDAEGIAQLVPGLTFSPFSPGQNIIALRGVSSNDDGAGTDNSVAVFVDGVYSGRVSTVNPPIFDLESVEVLRGPQGTLRGKNTLAGAILYNTRKPNHDGFEGLFTGTYGNYDRRELAGYITGPIAGDLAAKVSASWRERDGYRTNQFLGTRVDDDDQFSVRGQLEYSGSVVNVLLQGDYSELDLADMGRILLTGDRGLPFIPQYQAVCGTDFDPQCTANPVDGFSRQKSYGGSAQIDIETDAINITSITAYREARNNWLMDSIGSPALPVGDLIDDATDQFTQELRFSGDAANLNYVFGLWYSNEQTDRTEVFDVGVQGDILNSDRYRQINATNSYAVFGQVDWDVSDSVVLTLGGRYSIDDKSIENFAFAGDFVIINSTFQNQRSASFKSFTPKASLLYRLDDDNNVYFTYSKGFKSGGFAAAPTDVAATDPLKPEESQNFEAGYKGDLLDNTLRLNIAAFYTTYDDLQYQSFGPLPGNTFGEFRTVNFGSSRAYGAEVEFTWNPIPAFTLAGSYGYLNSQYEEAFIPNSSSPDQSGLDAIRSPRHKFAIDAKYDIETSAGTFTPAASYRYTGRQRGEADYDIINGQRVPYAFQPAFDIADFSLTWKSLDERFEAQAWLRNAFDEEWVSHIYTIGGDVIGVFGAPQTYGLTLTARFGN